MVSRAENRLLLALSLIFGLLGTFFAAAIAIKCVGEVRPLPGIALDMMGVSFGLSCLNCGIFVLPVLAVTVLANYSSGGKEQFSLRDAISLWFLVGPLVSLAIIPGVYSLVTFLRLPLHWKLYGFPGLVLASPLLLPRGFFEPMFFVVFFVALSVSWIAYVRGMDRWAKRYRNLRTGANY
jgi:hypothetical protein